MQPDHDESIEVLVKAVPKTATRKNASVVRSQSHDHRRELSRRSLLVGSGAFLGTGMAADTLISPSDALAANTPVSRKWELVNYHSVSSF